MVHRPTIAAALTALALAFFCGCDEGPSLAAPTATATAAAADPPPVDRAPLAFAVEGRTHRTLARAELEKAIGAETFTVFDPYYRRDKTYRALPLGEVLALGFAGRGLELSERHFVLRARDGYTVPIEGARLLEEGAYLAIEDVNVPEWEPIGQQKANPGPYYLVWKKPNQQDTETHPRPWQLSTIEVASFEHVFARLVPTSAAPGSAARRGFAIFREQCVRCHAINQQGGQLGPELNVPQNILEYRPEEQVRAYIKNPQTFRYSKMPSFAGLSDGDLDDIVAYLGSMAAHKHHPADGGAP